MIPRWRPILAQSLNGHHLLFAPGVVRFALAHAPGSSGSLDPKTAAGVAVLLDAVDDAGVDLAEQRDRIAGAPLPVQEALVRLYFDALDRYIASQGPVLH